MGKKKGGGRFLPGLNAGVATPDKQMSDAFASLRTLLLKTPDELVWGELTKLFTKLADSEEYPLMLAYAEQHMTEWDDSLRRLEGFPHESPIWPLVREVRFGGEEIGDAHFDKAVEDPALLQHITRMTLGWTDIPTKRLARLFRDDSLIRLTFLDLEGCSYLTEDVERMLEMPSLQSLEEFRLGWNNIPVSGLKAFFVSEDTFPMLKRFYFENNEIVNDEVKVIADTKRLEQLTLLKLYNNDINDSGLEIVVRSEACRNLEFLDLSMNHLHNGSALAIARSEHLKNLRTLDLDDNPGIKEEGWLALLHSPHLTQVKIECSPEGLSDETMTTLQSSERFEIL